MRLSAIIITKNEEATIARCLLSLAFAGERIVVDAQSSDRTVAIARTLGATVHVRPWPGYGEQKNFGRQVARGDWLLFVDADEEVTPPLQAEIERELKHPRADFYWLKITTVFLGRPLTHLVGHNPRLVQRDSGHWTDALVHEQVQTLAGETVTLGDHQSVILNSPLLHHSHASVRSYLTTMHRYTALEAAEMAKTHRHRSGRAAPQRWWLPWWLAIRQFLKLFFHRRGFLDGLPGTLWCALSAYYEWELGRTYVRALHAR